MDLKVQYLPVRCCGVKYKATFKWKHPSKVPWISVWAQHWVTASQSSDPPPWVKASIQYSNITQLQVNVMQEGHDTSLKWSYRLQKDVKMNSLPRNNHANARPCDRWREAVWVIMCMCVCVCGANRYRTSLTPLKKHEQRCFHRSHHGPHLPPRRPDVLNWFRSLSPRPSARLSPNIVHPAAETERLRNETAKTRTRWDYLGRRGEKNERK